MIKLDLKIWLKKIFYIVLLIPFFVPRYFMYGPKNYSKIFNAFLMITAIITLFLTIKNSKIKSNIIYLTIFLAFLFVPTIIYNGDINTCFTIFLDSITLSLLINYMSERNCKLFYSAFNDLLVILILINILSIIFFPTGLYIDSNGYKDNWFLGFKNIHILFIMPGIIVNIINSYINRGKLLLSNYIFIFICLSSLILSNSSTSILGISILLIYLIFKKVLNNLNFINIKSLSLTYLVLFFSVIIFKVQNLLSFIFVDILHKDLTFTGRTIVWSDVIKLIGNKPIFGYGVEYRFTRLARSINLQVYHAHNEILEIIYKTGLIGLISFVIFFTVSVKKLYINKDNEFVKVLSFIMFIFMVMMLTEAYSLENILYVFAIFYNVDYILKCRRKDL